MLVRQVMEENAFTRTRRETKNLIKKGRIQLNGVVVTNPNWIVKKGSVITRVDKMGVVLKQVKV